MALKILSIEAAIQDPEVRGGRPVVVGTTIRVSDIAAYHVYEGMSPEQLAVQFDLDLAQVHAVLSYYFSHRAEVDEEIRENMAEAERWKVELTVG